MEITELENGHIRIDLIMRRFSKRVQAVSELFTSTACASLFAVMAVATYKYAIHDGLRGSDHDPENSNLSL